MRDALGDVQSVLVLGAGSEIAQAIIDELLGHRLCRVTFAVRTPAAVETRAEELRGRGIDVDVVPFDSTLIETHAQFVERMFATSYDIDLVIVAFGMLGDQSRADHDVDHALDIVRTNFDGAVSVLIPVAQRLAVQGHGTIVVLSSVAALRPRRANFVYASSKAGLDAFANGLADAYADTGVHVMVVRPGFVATKMTAGMTPAPFATTPEVVARETVHGIRRNATIVYAPSTLNVVMPLLRLLPRVIWRKLRD